ncbi:MAG: peptidyl-prolyl cis-trans isomerase [Schaedlerella sp.]|nr:peptidyl-prolyl cis-trans isomerase [Lachnospiraceae bacterium AM23-2LB]RJW00947.1 peptidyl-prolyl cis-trans isomerase [Lachnospiraceae bacterium AM40-2BH]CDA99185.1 putative uncharacterized protein [Lachnospiraceae bacterium CAG:215]
MKQSVKRMAVLTAAGALALTSLTGCTSFDNDDAVATVGKEEIPAGVANFYARMQQAQYETYYAPMMGTTGEALWQQEMEEGKTYEESTKETLLLNLENLYLIRQHAEEYEVALTEEDTKAIEEAAKKFDEDNALEEKEAVSGYKKYIEEYLELVTIQSRMDPKMKEGVNEEVSDEEAAQKSMKYVYFPYSTTDADGNTKDLTEDEKKELKKTAQTFADTLKVSETKDIDALAQKGGYEVKTTTFDSESTAPNADLVKALDALTTEGDVTDVIESDYGIYVGKLTSLLDREATDTEKTNIVAQRKQEQYDSLLADWRKETEITENKKVWNKIDFEKQGVTAKQSDDQYDDAADAE